MNQMWLFVVLVVIPIIEILLFIEVGGWIGAWPTVGIVILTALIGTMLLRQQGFAALADLQRQLSEGQDPRATLAHGAMILVAGIVLLTPGFFTDALGFFLLIPQVRAGLIQYFATRIEMHTARQSQNARANRETIDGDYVDVTSPEPDEQTTPGNSAWTKGPSAANPPR
ncbi:MAG: FxsA family protein [Pseudomonadota bacterium]